MTTRPRANAAMRKPKDPAGSRAGILRAATDEFAARGLEGARIDAIARRTRTTRAMIYYYFASKAGLYQAVLEEAYRGIREAERALDLAHLPAKEAIRALVSFTYDYYQAHPEFVALVVAENQAGGRHIRRMPRIRRLNASIVNTIGEVLERGQRDGTLRADVDAIDLHMTIAALGWFEVANRHTFGYLFKRDFAAPATASRERDRIVEVVWQYVRGPREAATAMAHRRARWERPAGTAPQPRGFGLSKA
jgi:AcrR family transcriptional regulator